MICSHGVMVGYEQSADHDITTTLFTSPGASTIHSFSSALALSSSHPLSSPSFLIMFSLVALQAWLVVDAKIGGDCGGGAHGAAVMSSVDVGDELSTMSHT